MIKTMIKGRKVKVILEKEIEDWFFEEMSPQDIAERINRDLKLKIIEQAVNDVLESKKYQIQDKVTEIVINKIITEDLINESMRDEIKRRLLVRL